MFVNRRTYLTTVAAGAGLGVAGCLGTPAEDTDNASTSVATWSDGHIEFGLPPFQDAEELERQYAGLFAWLEAGFDGVTVDGTQTTSYSAVIESVTAGHTELANLSPLIYVMAADEGVTPLAVNELRGETSYHSYIATYDGSDIETLSDLAGATVAMVDPLSTSGGLFPMYTLEEAGLDTGGIDGDPVDLDIEWAFGHDLALQALENEHVDAAAFGDFIFDSPPDRIDVIAESEPIPLAAAVTQPDTPDDVVTALRERLYATPEEALAEHDVTGFSEYDADEYGTVRDIAERFGISVSDLEADA